VDATTKLIVNRYDDAAHGREIPENFRQKNRPGNNRKANEKSLVTFLAALNSVVCMISSTFPLDGAAETSSPMTLAPP
jgi:hypothetical protein